MTVTLKNVSHPFAEDIDALLVGPAGQNLVLVSDAGAGATTNVTATFDDAAGSLLPASGPWGPPNGSVTAKPTDYDPLGAPDTFPPPAPAVSAASTLATFSGVNPNGTWSLYVVDDAAGDAGSIGGGWCVTVVPALLTPGVSTQATPTVTVGSPVSDTATVTGAGAPAPAPTGTVTFTLFSDATCSAGPVFTSANRPLGGGPPPTATSAPFTPAATGSYRWVASYSGDASYLPVTSACGAPNETSAVTRASPSISTQASPGNVLGAPVRDVATLSGGLGPAGSVTFRLFSDTTCATQVFASTNPLSGPSATSAWFTPAATGTYFWIAAYLGDAKNNPATSACHAPNESVVIAPFQPPTFTRTISGDFVGPVTVNSGESVLITSARVVGPVTVNPGGSLTVVGSQISQGITANAPRFLSVCGTQVSGPSPAQALGVSNAAVPIRIGDPANGCAGNRFAGDVNLTANLAVTFGANIVSNNVNVNNNGPGNTVIKANNVFQALACAGNIPAPTNAGQPNTAGSKSGQCVGV